MKNLLIAIQDIINSTSSVFEADVPNELFPYVKTAGDNFVTTSDKVLHIVCTKKFAEYQAGQSWNIYQQDILDAINNIGKKDSEFLQRSVEGCFSYVDVESIVRKASYKLVRLYLPHKPK